MDSLRSLYQLFAIRYSLFVYSRIVKKCYSCKNSWMAKFANIRVFANILLVLLVTLPLCGQLVRETQFHVYNYIHTFYGLLPFSSLPRWVFLVAIFWCKDLTSETKGRMESRHSECPDYIWMFNPFARQTLSSPCHSEYEWHLLLLLLLRVSDFEKPIGTIGVRWNS